MLLTPQTPKSDARLIFRLNILCKLCLPQSGDRTAPGTGFVPLPSFKLSEVSNVWVNMAYCTCKLLLTYLRDAKQKKYFEPFSSSSDRTCCECGVQVHITHTHKTATDSWCCCIDSTRVCREKLLLENQVGS